MAYSSDNTIRHSVEEFRRYDIDTQLALLWYGYLDIKDELTPAPPETDDNLAHVVYRQIEALSPEQQLQAQRDILRNVENEIGRVYTALSPGARIEVWLLLGQGMEEGAIIQVPSDYKLPTETQDFSHQIAQMSFEQRLDFMRSAVLGMGAQSARA